MNLCGKSFKAAARIQITNSHAGTGFHQELMIRKPHIYKPAMLLLCSLNIRIDKGGEILDAIHLPDHIVALFQAG